MEPYTLVGGTQSNNASDASAGRPWNPGFWEQLPWTGLLALLFGIGCGIAALIVALVSDGEPLDHWTVGTYAVQPPVLIAVLVTLANAALGYAFTSGVAISWWTGAISGRTLGHLHASQSQGASLMGLFQKRPVVSKVTAGSVLMLLLLVDQPFFQRGIRVVNRPQQLLEAVTIPISSSPLRWGATGILPPQRTMPELYHPVFAEVARQFQAREPIKLNGFSCSGQCDAEIVAAGWDIACAERSSQYLIVDEDKDKSNRSTSLDELPGPRHIQTVFNVSFAFPEWPARSGSHYINASTLYKATPGLNGASERRRDCTLSEALVRYPVQLSGDTLVRLSMPWTVNRTIKRVSRAPEPPGDTNWPSTLGGIWLALDRQYSAQVDLYRTPLNSVAMYTNDTISNAYLQSPSDDPNEVASYNTTWADPMDDIISTAQELMLRTAIATTGRISWPQAGEQTNTQSAPGFPRVNHTLDQEVEVTMSSMGPVYETHSGWLAGAFSTIALAFLSIIPTYWGWWHLGRPVSLSVLEVAKAFDAPLLRHADANGAVDEHLGALGNMRVRYGFGPQYTTGERNEDDSLPGPHLAATSNDELDADRDDRLVSSKEEASNDHRSVVSPQSEPRAHHGTVNNRYFYGKAGRQDKTQFASTVTTPSSGTRKSSLSQGLGEDTPSATALQQLMFLEDHSFDSGTRDTRRGTLRQKLSSSSTKNSS